MNRRDYMKALGLSATAVGLPGILSSIQRARAGDECPLRFVIFYEQHGYAQRFARARRPGQDDFIFAGGTPPGEASGDWTFGPAFEPIADYKSRTIQLAGMDMLSARLPNATADFGGHGHHKTNALTSSPRVSHNTPGGPSIDQYIADGLAAQGIVSRVPSAAVAISGRGTGQTPVYRPDGTPVPCLVQPPTIYDRFFPAELQASGEERAMQAARRTSAANLVESLGTSLTRRLSRDQRSRAEAHMQLHRDLQARLAVSTMGAIPDRESSLGIWSEALPYINDNSRRDLGVDELGMWQLTKDINIGLVAAALHADITRVAVVKSDWAPDASIDFRSGDEERMIDGTFGRLNLHAFQHEVENEPNLGAAGDEMMIRYHQQTTSTLKQLLDTLASLPEDNGTSVLDNTIVLCATEMADPGHRPNLLNWHVIGDAQGQFRTDRSLILERRARSDNAVAAIDGNYGRNTTGPGHGQLFVTLANAMGVPTETFGEPSICPGPIDLS